MSVDTYKNLLEALKPLDPMQQLANLNKLVERPMAALAEEARQESKNADYAKRFLNLGSE